MGRFSSIVIVFGCCQYPHKMTLILALANPMTVLDGYV